MKIRIRVSRKDIDHGERSQCKRCPIARGITRRLKKGLFAHVGSTTFSIRRGDYGVTCLPSSPLPSKATTFIDDYDNCRGVAPISFELNIPAKFLKR